MEVILEVKAKKACVFNGFRRQTTKSTASRPPAAHLSSASADLVRFYNSNAQKAPENFVFPGLSYNFFL